MRLVCPSCETEYEVQDGMIPAAGRDVQCSNCMVTWFQSGPTKAAPEVAADLKIDRSDDTVPPAPRRPKPEPKPKPPAPVSDDFDDEDTGDLSDLPPAAIAAMAAKRQSPKIDDEALGVIHDEVAREQSARKAEAGAIETQIDLGIDDTESKDRAAAARDRMRAKTGADPETHDITEVDPDLEDALTEELPAEPTHKRELLPDIEEINSTLTESPDGEENLEDYVEMTPARHPKSRNRSGFRLGFGLMLLVSAALVGLYVYAPAFSKSVPAMAGFLESYVATIDAFRVWLDRSAQDLSDQITKLLGTVN